MRNQAAAIILTSTLVFGCGGGGDDSTVSTSGEAVESSVRVSGDWQGEVFLVNDNCPGDDEQSSNYGLAFSQEGSAVTVVYQGACENGLPETGNTTSDGFATRSEHAVRCPGGGEALRIDTTEFAGVAADTVADVRFTIEIGCPSSYCFLEYRGTGNRLDPNPKTCSEILSGNLSATPTPAPTVGPIPTATSTPTPAPAPTANPTTDSRCSRRPTCGELNSCAEAQFFFSVCGQGNLDGDDDGVPCEVLCE